MKKTLIAAAVLLVVVLAVSIPSLLRARISSGESPVIGDARSVLSGMWAYQSVNGGFYEGRLECLAEPSKCLPGWGPDQPTFLDPIVAVRSRKRGSHDVMFEVTFIPGPPVPAEEIAKAKASRTSARCFALVSVPLAEGARSFCADCSGRICFYRDGRQPPLAPDGSCGSRGPDGKLQPACDTIQ